MITFEQIEKLRKHAQVSYDEAKNALEMSNGDMLDAIILLEKRGKATTQSPYQGYKQTYEPKFGYQNPNWQYQKQIPTGYSQPSLWTRMVRRVKELFNWSLTNHFIIYRNGHEVAKLPMFVLIVLLLWAYAVIPILLVGLLFGFSYSFGGRVLNPKASHGAQNNNTNWNNNTSTAYNQNSAWGNGGAQNKQQGNDTTVSGQHGASQNAAEQYSNGQPYVSPFKNAAQPSQNNQEAFKDFSQQPEMPYVSPFKTSAPSPNKENQNFSQASTTESSLSTSQSSDDNPENVQL